MRKQEMYNKAICMKNQEAHNCFKPKDRTTIKGVPHKISCSHKTAKIN